MNPNTKPTTAQIEGAIKEVTYTRTPSGKAIVCEITMANGFVVHGISALVDLDNYNEALGRQAAFAHAKSEVWALVAYDVQTKISTGEIESRHDELLQAYRTGVDNQAVTLTN